MSKINPQKLIKKNPFILAPMDDVTDLPFRELCEKKGSCYTISELTSVDALIRDKVYPSRYEKGNLKINCIQLFGHNPDTFIQSAKKLEGIADIIDVNFGCPSPSVNSNNSGAILLKDPKNVGKIIEKLVKHSSQPITAKIRLGYKSSTYKEVAKEIEDAGAQLIAVHGRTAQQKYSGLANWDAIKEIYENSNIPIIGNGDIKSTTDIDNYLKSHCDALMIGRAAIGNPLIFEEFSHYFKTGKKLEIQNIKEKRKELFLEYIEILEKYETPKIEMKIQKQAMWFFKGINGVKELRSKIQKTKDIEKILKIIDEF